MCRVCPRIKYLKRMHLLCCIFVFDPLGMAKQKLNLAFLVWGHHKQIPAVLSSSNRWGSTVVIFQKLFTCILSVICFPCHLFSQFLNFTMYKKKSENRGYILAKDKASLNPPFLKNCNNKTGKVGEN